MVSTLSDLDLCNAALVKLGALPIAGFDDPDAAAAVCRTLYPVVVDAALTSRPWSFTLKRATLSPIDGRSVQAAADAVRKVDGRDPVYVRTGGTIPVVADFQRLLGTEVVLVDMGLEDDRIHSPNEKFDVDLYHRGIHLSAELLRSLGRA